VAKETADLFVKVNEDIELLNLVQILLDLHGTRR